MLWEDGKMGLDFFTSAYVIAWEWVAQKLIAFNENEYNGK